MNFFYIKKLILNLFIIEFFLFRKIGSSTIKFKIKTLKFLGKNNNNIYINNEIDEEKYFYYDLILNNIYTSILLGSPPQNILGFYSGKINEFDILHERCFINHSKYDRTKSDTFYNLSSFNITHKDYKNACFAKENFLFEQYIDGNENNNNKYITVNQLKFFLPDDYKKLDNNNTCAIIGLQLNNKDIFKETPKNFVHYLIQNVFNEKNNNNLNINSFYWTIKYNNLNTINNIDDDEGFFSIGDPPHEYDPDHYKKNNFIEFNIESGHSSLYWGIKFNEIFLNKSSNIYLKKYFWGHNCLFYQELNIILSTIDYYNTIKKEFFNEFLKDRICFEKKIFISQINSTVINGLSGEYVIIFCDKNKVDEYGINKFYLDFPSVNFYHKLMNYTFVFKGNDLFYEDKKEKKIYFLIAKKNNEVDQWIFGKIFMKKYQVIFNSEMKTIGFYINTYSNDNKYYNNYIGNTNFKVIALILFSFFVLIVAILLGYKYKKSLFTKNKIIVKELEMVNKNVNLTNYISLDK